MITSLTEAQKAKFPEYVAKYTAYGLSCEPADRARAERGIRAHYDVAGKPQPEKIVWVSSPLAVVTAGPIAAWVLENEEKVVSRLRAIANKGKAMSLPDVGDDPIEYAVQHLVRKAGVSPCRGMIGTLDKLREEIKAGIQGAWANYLGGAWWIAFTAWACYIRDELGVNVPIGPREDTDLSCGWWWPHEKFVVVSDRPLALHRDEQGRLHSATEAAISFRDGWGCYFWHGVEVPKEWILNPGGIDPRTVLTHENIEQRRCAAEIVGWAKVLDLLKPSVIDADEDPEIGTLLEVPLEGERERFLKVRCGTGRTFVLPVPPEMQTALEANAWTYGIDGNALRQLEVRT
jgi:hypothetical protein